MSVAKSLNGHFTDFVDVPLPFPSSLQFFTKPPIKKLLPDYPPFPPGYVPPKTLVLNLTGTLIHTNYVVRPALPSLAAVRQGRGDPQAPGT